MATATPSSSPRLAPPGAGLPAPELLVARLLFRLHRWRHDQVARRDLFVRERDTIVKLVRSVPPVAATQQVLIKRLPGMEDSSRNWSLCMVVEHLRMVNRGIRGAMVALKADRLPPEPASTATVKPAPGVRIEVVEAFASECDDFLNTIDGLGDLSTRLRYTHPWFGPLDAEAWWALVGFHQRLHRKQIERILATMAA